MLLFLRRIAPQQRLLCICGDPTAVQRAFGLVTVPIYRKLPWSSSGRGTALVWKAASRITLWFHAMRHLRRLKVLIIPGTGVLDDFSVNPLGWPHDLLSWCVLARLMGRVARLVEIG